MTLFTKSQIDRLSLLFNGINRPANFQNDKRLRAHLGIKKGDGKVVAHITSWNKMKSTLSKCLLKSKSSDETGFKRALSKAIKGLFGAQTALKDFKSEIAAVAKHASVYCLQKYSSSREKDVCATLTALLTKMYNYPPNLKAGDSKTNAQLGKYTDLKATDRNDKIIQSLRACTSQDDQYRLAARHGCNVIHHKDIQSITQPNGNTVVVTNHYKFKGIFVVTSDGTYSLKQVDEKVSIAQFVIFKSLSSK